MSRMLAKAIFFLLLLGTVARGDERPNILFIFTDDHALKALSAYGGPLAEIAPTPHLDRIAREGMLFGGEDEFSVKQRPMAFH